MARSGPLAATPYLIRLSVNLLLTGDSVTIDRALAAIAALLVTLGFWTPIAGVFAALCLIWSAVSNNHVWPCLLAAPIGIALSLVGPVRFRSMPSATDESV